MTIDAIKNAIAALPIEQRHSLVSWLNEIEYGAWDNQMVKNFSPGGRGMTWIDKAKREIAEGRTIPLAEGRDLAKVSREQSRQ